jgi:hypothetical protein
MKNKMLFGIFLFSSLGAFAQPITREEFDKAIKPLFEKVKTLQTENTKLKSEIEGLNSKLSDANKSIDSLRVQTQKNIDAITQTANGLGIRIEETGAKNEGKIAKVQDSLSKKSLYGIIGVLSAILLSGLIYWMLRRKQRTDKYDVEGQLSQTKKTIEEEQIQINTKLAEVYSGQMELLKAERKTIPINGEVDHSLPLKVADEIVKMQMNLVHMDNKVRGHKQLSIAVTNVFDNFKANGYEIIDHLNKPYNDGMNMDASKEPDAALREGEQIIRRIIKPEVHFNKKMIQKAQVIVAYGE